MGVSCSWVKLDIFADFGLRLVQKCVWRPGSVRTHWGSTYSTPPDSLAVIRGGNVEGKEAEGIEGREGVRRERMGWVSK